MLSRRFFRDPPHAADKESEQSDGQKGHSQEERFQEVGKESAGQEREKECQKEHQERVEEGDRKEIGHQEGAGQVSGEEICLEEVQVIQLGEEGCEETRKEVGVKVRQ